MTEAEWLAAVEPGRMLWYSEKHFGDRKRQLFAAACLRRIAHLFPGPCCHRAVGILERFADGQATAEELVEARAEAREEGYAFDTGSGQHPSLHAAMAAAYDLPEYIADFSAEATAWVKVGTPEAISTPEEAAQAVLVREIFGNPFRPVAFNPAWRTTDVMLLARGTYDERAFDRMPILADALQEAGCDGDELLNHLRDPHATHVRGCWALDLVLGKE